MGQTGIDQKDQESEGDKEEDDTEGIKAFAAVDIDQMKIEKSLARERQNREAIAEKKQAEMELALPGRNECEGIERHRKKELEEEDAPKVGKPRPAIVGIQGQKFG